LTRVVLEAARWELRAELRAAYDALVADLRALGLEVGLTEAVERRGGGTSFTPPLADLVVHLSEELEAERVDAILAAIVARVGAGGGWSRTRQAIVLGPGDETVLRRVTLSE
jgi:hypothetical protein